MECPKDSAFASQLPVLDLTEMNTLLQLSYVAQQCLYTGEAQPQEPKYDLHILYKQGCYINYQLIAPE